MLIGGLVLLSLLLLLIYSLSLLILLLFFFLSLGTISFKKVQAYRFRLHWDEIWQDCSSRKYTLIDGVGFVG